MAGVKFKIGEKYIQLNSPLLKDPKPEKATKPQGRGIRLYLTTWKNPNSGKKVTSIDFIRNADTQASPFCVAITAE